MTAVNTNIKFEKNFYNDGIFDSYDGSSTTFKHLTVNPTGVHKGRQRLSMKLVVTGNFINNSTKRGEWKTEDGRLGIQRGRDPLLQNRQRQFRQLRQ